MQLVRVANGAFALILVAFWLAWRVFGPAIEAQRAFGVEHDAAQSRAAASLSQ